MQQDQVSSAQEMTLGDLNFDESEQSDTTHNVPAPVEQEKSAEKMSIG